MKKIKLGGFSKVVPTENTVKKYYSFHEYDNGINHQIVREIYVLKRIKSPYVISLLEVEQDFKYIELPMYSIDLCDFINKNVLNTGQIQNIFFQVCSGIYALHSAQIIHRDIKPENICLSHDSYQDNIRAVLIDTGYSKKNNDKMTPRAGTVCYQAPEMLAGSKYSYEIDIWGAGCILGTMCSRKILFPNGLSELELINLQVKMCGTPVISSETRFKFLEWLPIRSGKLEKRFRQYGDELYNLIIKMLNIDPRQRFTITQCLNSSYLGNNNFKEIELNESSHLESSRKDDNVHNYKIKVLPQWRKVLLEWMSELCQQKFGKEYISPSTYPMAIKILDEFTFKTKHKIDRKNYQLIGMGCLLLASKLESVIFFKAETLAYLGYEKEKDLLEMEKIILRDCEFN